MRKRKKEEHEDEDKDRLRAVASSTQIASDGVWHKSMGQGFCDFRIRHISTSGWCFDVC